MLYTERVKILPTDEQKIIIDNLINTYMQLYNLGVIYCIDNVNGSAKILGSVIADFIEKNIYDSDDENIINLHNSFIHGLSYTINTDVYQLINKSDVKARTDCFYILNNNISDVVLIPDNYINISSIGIVECESAYNILGSVRMIRIDKINNDSYECVIGYKRERDIVTTNSTNTQTQYANTMTIDEINKMIETITSKITKERKTLLTKEANTVSWQRQFKKLNKLQLELHLYKKITN